MKPIVVSHLKGKNDPFKITFGNVVQKGISDSPDYFPDGAPVVAKLKTATDNLKKAYTDYKTTNSTFDKDQTKLARVAFNNVIDDVKLYVQGKCNNDLKNATAIAHAACFRLKRKGEKLPKPGMVKVAQAVHTKEEGTILVVVKKRPLHAKIFEVWVTTDLEDEKSWKLAGMTDTKKLMVKNLTSGKYYYFRIYASNRAGKSVPSNPYRQMSA